MYELESQPLEGTLATYDLNQHTSSRRTMSDCLFMSVACSEEGDLVAASGQEISTGAGVVAIWNSNITAPPRRIVTGRRRVHGVDVSPDGKHLATCQLDGSVRLWDSETGAVVRTLQDDYDYVVTCIRFSPDGKWIAAGMALRRTEFASWMGNVVKVWEVKSGRLSRSLKGHAFTMTSALVAGSIVWPSFGYSQLIVGEPVKLPMPINSDEYGSTAPSISADGLTMFFTSGGVDPLPGIGNLDIWMSKRDSLSAPWQPLENLGEAINSEGWDMYPTISPDGRSLFFTRSLFSGFGGETDADIWMASRASDTDPWQPAIRLPNSINDPDRYDGQTGISADGKSLYFNSDRNGSQDLWVSTRGSVDLDWTEPVNLGDKINTPSSSEGTPSVTPDGQWLFFTSDRPGRLGTFDIWASRWTDDIDEWGEPESLGEVVNNTSFQFGTSVSSDGSTLYVSRGSGLDASLDIWAVPIPEPSSLTLLLIGLVAIARRFRGA